MLTVAKRHRRKRRIGVCNIVAVRRGSRVVYEHRCPFCGCVLMVKNACDYAGVPHFIHTRCRRCRRPVKLWEMTA